MIALTISSDLCRAKHFRSSKLEGLNILVMDPMMRTIHTQLALVPEGRITDVLWPHVETALPHKC